LMMQLMTEREEHNARTSAKWRRVRTQLLQQNLLCVMCRKEGKAEPAVVADHVEQVDHCKVRFWTGQLQGLCKLYTVWSAAMPRLQDNLGCDGHQIVCRRYGASFP